MDDCWCFPRPSHARAVSEARGTVRRTLFWIHLVCGIGVGLVVGTLGVTGALLAFEQQLVEWADREYWTDDAPAPGPTPVDAVLDEARAYTRATGTGDPLVTLTIYSDPGAPVAVAVGRERVLYLDRTNGSVLGENRTGIRSFLTRTTEVHRWLALSDQRRSFGRAVVGWSSVLFLLLLASGLVMWLPRRPTWQHLRPVLWFRRTSSSRARDFNWHHVVGAWSAIPLLLMTATGIAMAFPAINDWTHEQLASWMAPPQDVPTWSGVQLTRQDSPPSPRSTGAGAEVPLSTLLEAVSEASPGWRTISINLLRGVEDDVEFTTDRGWGRDPRARQTWVLDREGGAYVSGEAFTSFSEERRARLFVRYAHTGEFFGLVGQFVAGLASLAVAVLLWTGWALALRRLGRWRTRRGEP